MSMKKILQTLAVVSTLALTASQAFAFGIIPAFPSSAQVASAAQAACNLLPDVATVNAVIHANGAIQDAEAFGKLICQEAGLLPLGGKRLGVVAPNTAFTKTVVINGQAVVISGVLNPQ